MLKQRLMVTGAIVAAAFSMGTLAGCHSGDTDKDKSVTSSQQEAKAGAQQRFNGTLPCADCAGILTDLTLNFTQDGQPDGFTLSQTYQGTNADDNHTFSFKGDFAVLTGNTPEDPKGVVYHLMPDDEKEPATYYQRINDTTLKMLDKDMKQIQSEQNYALTRSTQ